MSSFTRATLDEAIAKIKALGPPPDRIRCIWIGEDAYKKFTAWMDEHKIARNTDEHWTWPGIEIFVSKYIPANRAIIEYASGKLGILELDYTAVAVGDERCSG